MGASADTDPRDPRDTHLCKFKPSCCHNTSLILGFFLSFLHSYFASVFSFFFFLFALRCLLFRARVQGTTETKIESFVSSLTWIVDESDLVLFFRFLPARRSWISESVIRPPATPPASRPSKNPDNSSVSPCPTSMTGPRIRCLTFYARYSAFMNITPGNINILFVIDKWELL